MRQTSSECHEACLCFAKRIDDELGNKNLFSIDLLSKIRVHYAINMLAKSIKYVFAFNERIFYLLSLQLKLKHLVSKRERITDTSDGPHKKSIEIVFFFSDKPSPHLVLSISFVSRPTNYLHMPPHHTYYVLVCVVPHRL